MWYLSAMPLPAKVRRERRAYQKQQDLKLAPPQKKSRKRCENCGTWFQVEARLKKGPRRKKFCKPECRREFGKNGMSAFGPLKEKIKSMIRQETGDIWEAIQEIRDIFEKVTAGETLAAIDLGWKRRQAKAIDESLSRPRQNRRRR